MYPSQHIIIGFITSLIIFIIFPQITLIGFFIIWLSSFMIDIDHYFYFVYRKKSLNPKRAYEWFITQSKKFHSLTRKQKNISYGGIFIFHGIEIILVFILLSYFHNYFSFVALGFAIHLALDIIYELTLFDRIDRVSLIYDFINIRRLKFIEDL